MSTSTTQSTSTLRLWQRARDLPFGIGSRVFSVAASLKAPYFRTALPHIVEMEPGRAVVRGPKWWGVQNHIGTFHVIAALNLAEVAMGMLAEATVPTTHRWIPKGMTADYLTKTSGGLTVTAELDELPDFDAITEGVTIPVPISLVDASGTETIRATIDIWVTRKKK